jgi:hypothetical protein
MTRPNILHILSISSALIRSGPEQSRYRTPNLTGSCAWERPLPTPIRRRRSASRALCHDPGQYPAHTSCYENTPMPTDNRQSFMDALAAGGYRRMDRKCHFSRTRSPCAFPVARIQEEGWKAVG